jgi:predicted nucleic acid-binding protein
MPAVSEAIAVNTGPLIALAACDSLDLLRRLHQQVLVPVAVVEEFGRGGPGTPGSGGLPSWFDVRSLGAPMPPMLIAHLDQGEASAIALALEARVGLVAIDERRGRLVAREMGLAVTGSLGVLLRAKRLGVIDAVGPRVAIMRQKGIWLGEMLVRRVLVEAQEPLQRPFEPVE